MCSRLIIYVRNFEKLTFDDVHISILASMSVLQEVETSKHHGGGNNAGFENF